MNSILMENDVAAIKPKTLTCDTLFWCLFLEIVVKCGCVVLAEDGNPVLIDFPQMVSTAHPNAREFFERDVTCIQDFFKRR